MRDTINGWMVDHNSFKGCFPHSERIWFSSDLYVAAILAYGSSFISNSCVVIVVLAAASRRRNRSSGNLRGSNSSRRGSSYSSRSAVILRAEDVEVCDNAVISSRLY